ncbi:SurA N-terminal domain-containing protein [Croceicoccus sp. F390]|uniref:Parvulin-like PPIase n=1 Tax=Croceicoccus esteveae TaxID=3075597 RepID=A0ABU2ZGN8_9SPHN|nr:SurA N-terminal domain-containing protein [Croceicoccus sp. F390]MDT0575479.1 SurA N-terminal domain-containing protein [Croceicoccus sp. F390]
MIQGFRKLFKSKIGLALVLAFVGLIALAFASADITGFGFGGVAGTERAAKVGDETITTGDLRQTVAGAYDAARQERPDLTMQEFVATGGVDAVLDQMIERAALYDFGRQNGVRIGDALVGSELTRIGVFRGPDGNFSEQAYRQALVQQGISEAILRADIEGGLVARVILEASTFGGDTPALLARRYAMLLTERREGAIALLPSAAFAGTKPISDATLQDYLGANRERYLLPERRTIRYAVIDSGNVVDVTATPAEIAAQYRQDAVLYEGSELRNLSQLVLPTEAAAQAVLKSVDGGASLDAAAKNAGLSTAQLTRQSREALAAATTEAVAQAAFATAKGELAGPIRGPLGWYVLRVDSIESKPARSLAQVRAELAETVTAQKRRDALADLAARAEEQLVGGASLAEVARSLDVPIRTTGLVLENGSAFGSDEAPLAQIARIAPAAFAMDEDSDPQIAAGEDGTSYVLYAPGEIRRSAPPEFADLRSRLVADYRLEQGEKLARSAADRVIAAVTRGASLGEALRMLETKVPPPETVALSRQQLVSSGQSVPPPLALMFTMAKGAPKKITAPGNQGWYVVALNEIETRDIEAGNPLLAQMQQELTRLRREEYAQQLGRAIMLQTSIRRSDSAIGAVRTQLVGQN